MGMFMTSDSQRVAVGAVSAQFGTSMVEGQGYALVSTTDAWIAIGANPTAAASTSGSIFVKAGVIQPIAAVPGSLKVAVIQASAGGDATLTRVL